MARLEQRMSAPDFWQDQQGAQKMLQRRKRLEGDLGFLKRLRGQEDDTRVLVEWAEGGEDVEKDLRAALDGLEETISAAAVGGQTPASASGHCPSGCRSRRLLRVTTCPSSRPT